MSNYRRSRTSGGTFFFTLVTYERQSLFTTPAAREILRNAINEVRKNYPFTIDAWVLLPDHLHCIWTLPENDNDFSKRWGLIKAGFSKQAKQILPSPEPTSSSRTKHRESSFWQRRFWEHKIRDEEDFRNHIDYIHYNPMKHGLTKAVKDWPYSTFHKFVAEGLYPDDWCGSSAKDDTNYGE